MRKNKIIIGIFTLIFGISPFVIMWNVPVLTESLSIFEMTFLALLTIQYLKKPRYILSGSIGILILIMIMTRPSFIYVFPIYFLFWILRIFFNKKEKDIKQAIVGICSCVICGIFLFIYCFLMLQQYGKFALTGVADLNNVVSVIQSKAYKKTNNEEMIKVIDEALQEGKTIWETCDVLKSEFDKDQINELLKVATKTSEHKQFLIQKTFILGSKNIGLNYVDNINLSDKDKPYVISYKYIGEVMMPITFGTLYWLIVVNILYLIYNFIKNKNINWMVAFFMSLIFANIFTLIIGAPEEEQRLFSASIPLVMLYLVYFLNNTIKKGEKNE